MRAHLSRAGARLMATYQELQNALARYADIEEQYWLALENKAKVIKNGLTDYLGKAGQVTEVASENVPYVCLGVVEGEEFHQRNASQLPARDGALNFAVRVIIDADANPRLKVAHLINLKMSIGDGKLEVLICEKHQNHHHSFPDVFNERHQAQLFDAITDTIIKRLDISCFN